jgi:Tfp pilus assembly protein PilN
MPPEVWLSQIKIVDGNVTLVGGSVGFNQISDLMKNLNENIYFKDLTLKKTEQVKDKAGREYAEFELTAKRR